MLAYRSSVSNNWQGKEVSYILTAIDQVVVDIDYPSGYDADDFKWTSDDKSIATVKDGELKAKGTGSTNIKAESKDGKYYANCAVYVGE